MAWSPDTVHKFIRAIPQSHESSSLHKCHHFQILFKIFEQSNVCERANEHLMSLCQYYTSTEDLALYAKSSDPIFYKGRSAGKHYLILYWKVSFCTILERHLVPCWKTAFCTTLVGRIAYYAGRRHLVL